MVFAINFSKSDSSKIQEKIIVFLYSHLAPTEVSFGDHELNLALHSHWHCKSKHIIQSNNLKNIYMIKKDIEPKNKLSYGIFMVLRLLGRR